MSNGNAHQSKWSDRHHNPGPIDGERPYWELDGADAGAHVMDSDFSDLAERRERGEREWFRRVVNDQMGR